MIFTLIFGDYTFPNQTFEVDGFPQVNNLESDRIPRKHGAIMQNPYLQERKIKVKGTIHNNTREDSHDQLLDLQAALFNGEQNFQYRSDRFLKCYATKVDPKFADGTDKGVIKISIDLIAQDPFSLSSGASYSDVQSLNGGTTAFDIVNGGNIFSEPNIFIYASGGTITDEIKLTNVTDGSKFFRFRGEVANGTTLKLNTEELTVLNNGVDGISDYEGDFLNILGDRTNSFQYVGATCILTSEWRYRWYS